MSRFPFGSYPSGWFHLLWSDELKPGRALMVSAFGRRLHAARGDDGRVVVRERSGRRWPVSEKTGLVFVYYSPDELPSFELPDLHEAQSSHWSPAGRLEFTYESHVQEVIENAVDLAHFRCLHGFLEDVHLLGYERNRHQFRVTVAAPKRIFGFRKRTTLSISYCGMGYSVGRLEEPLPFLSIVTCLPVDGARIRQRFTMFVKLPRVALLTHLISPFTRWHVRKDIEEEIRVLAEKAYWTRPVLADGDGPIMDLRRWCKQFYTAPVAAAPTGNECAVGKI